jgi:hypothetical protein
MPIDIHPKPRIFADDRGVWCELSVGQVTGLPWDEIYGIAAYKLDGKIEIFTVIDIGTEYGEFVELFHDWPGFDDAVKEIARRLPGIDPQWFDRIERLSVADPPHKVWCRAK